MLKTKPRPRNKKFWTYEEQEFLDNNIINNEIKFIAAKLKRTETCVKQRVFKFVNLNKSIIFDN